MLELIQQEKYYYLWNFQTMFFQKLRKPPKCNCLVKRSDFSIDRSSSLPDLREAITKAIESLTAVIPKMVYQSCLILTSLVSPQKKMKEKIDKVARW